MSGELDLCLFSPLITRLSTLAGGTLKGNPYPEVTGLFCRVPSRAFSRAPENLHHAYLCRFQYGHALCPASAFLVSRADDFGIINALALAGRAFLAARSPYHKRPDTLNRRAWCRNINRLS